MTWEEKISLHPGLSVLIQLIKDEIFSSSIDNFILK